MKIQIRLTRELRDFVRSDLLRPHEYAYERVGFLSAKLSKSSDLTIIFFSDYFPIPDQQYIDDPRSGARIDSTAIREAMQRVLDTGDTAFHVHIHAHRGRPRFSPMDREEIPKIVSSLRNANPSLPHGMFLLSRDQAHARVLMPAASELTNVDRISIVGYPMTLIDSEELCPTADIPDSHF